MNEKLEFTHKYYNKYDTMRINIENGSLKLKEEDFRIINEIEKTDYDYRKAVVQLEQPDLCKLMNKWEAQINKHLKGNKIPPITILYGNKIYSKTYLDNPSNVSIIKIGSIWVNAEKKPFPQLWLE